jgi:hypothetical protein
MLEKKAYSEWLVQSSNQDNFYLIMKFLADHLNDHPKATDEELIEIVNDIIVSFNGHNKRDSDVKIWIDLIRDSCVIYKETIKQERKYVAMGR